MKWIKERFDELSGSQKRIVMVGLSVLSVIILIVIIYQARGSNDDVGTTNKRSKIIELNLSGNDDDAALQISLKNELAEAEELRLAAKAEQDIEIDELKLLIEELSNNSEKLKGSQTYGDLELDSIPLAPSDAEILEAEIKVAPTIIYGGISVEEVKVSSKKEQGSKKKKDRKRLFNFIPAGTMLKATLINGMYAPTMGKGKESPYPALLQTYDLAFLPNSVRKDLAGCFVLGEAFGELSDSRVHIRLSKISCISRDEQWVLQKQIKGFVNGDDGKVGIAGKIVANFGRLTLTVLLAEFLGSAGEAIKAATQVNTYNPLGGVTTTIGGTAEDIALSAAGAGIGESASMISEFYLDIMKEMSPVIEVNSRREVEIIIEEGTELLTDDFIWEGVIANEKE